MTANQAREVVEQLLAFEAGGELFECSFASEQVLLWPLVRWRVMQAAIDRVFDPSTVSRAPGRVSVRGRLRYLASSFRRDPLRIRRNFDVLIFGSSTGISTRREGKWFGRINDYFALEHEEGTLVIDAARQRAFREPRYPRHVARHDAIQLRAALRALGARRSSSTHERTASRFIRSLQQALPVPLAADVEQRIAQHLTSLGRRLHWLREYYLRLFEATAPKILFLEDASYGSQAYILKWARDFGIRTGEFQHGMITPTHLAYNYGPGIRTSASYARHLPEFLLTYGKFWNDSTRTTSTSVAIGNPHFEARRAELVARPARAGRTWVIISQSGVAAQLVALAVELRGKLASEDEIVYRLHPNEPAVGDEYKPLDAGGIHVSREGDIYELLNTADIVIGCWSTALFEAAGLGRMTYVYATGGSEFYVPRSFACWFSTADELIHSIATHATDAQAGERYFQPDWQTHFRRFLSDLGIPR